MHKTTRIQLTRAGAARNEPVACTRLFKHRMHMRITFYILLSVTNTCVDLDAFQIVW